MSTNLKLYDLSASPNSIKVRLALGYKNLPYEKIAVDPTDRAEIVRVSGQPLTPVLVHGETVVFDSASILRYLDGNFRQTPSLFSADYQEMKEIERWETWGRTQLGAPIGICFDLFFAEKKDPARGEEACRLMDELTARIEDRLASSEWLVGNRLTAVDVTCAPVVFYAMLPPEEAAKNDIARFFSRTLRMGEGREKTRAWARRVMAYDR